MAEQVKVTYDGIEIEYREREDDWHFELRGRERSSETLAKAKETIDKPVKEKNPFVRVAGFIATTYGDVPFVPCEITSLAEGTNWSSNQYVWVNRNGERKKVDAQIVILNIPENNKLIGEWTALDKQIREISLKMKALRAKMETYKAPEEQPA